MGNKVVCLFFFGQNWNMVSVDASENVTCVQIQSYACSLFDVHYLSSSPTCA